MLLEKKKLIPTVNKSYIGDAWRNHTLIVCFQFLGNKIVHYECNVNLETVYMNFVYLIDIRQKLWSCEVLWPLILMKSWKWKKYMKNVIIITLLRVYYQQTLLIKCELITTKWCSNYSFESVLPTNDFN